MALNTTFCGFYNEKAQVMNRRWFIMLHKQILQQLHRYHGAGLCIRKGVMVVHELISASCRNGLELMVR